MAIVIDPEQLTALDVYVLAQNLPSTQREWLRQLLDRNENTPLPDYATLDEAIALYLGEACSLGRAAELAGVTRWDLQDALKQRGIPLMVFSSHSVSEVDAMRQRLKDEGIL